jgi:hypothetical protein
VPGQSAATNVTVRVSPPTSGSNASVGCAPGERAVGGGITSDHNTSVSASEPTINGAAVAVGGSGQNPNGWFVSTGAETSANREAIVVCISP